MKDIRNDQREMGGITLVLAGDFRQTLPVVKRGTRADEVNACLKSSNLWPKFDLLSLSTNMRVHLYGDLNAEEFSSMLLEIGNGNVEEENGKIKIPTGIGTMVSNLDELIKNVYPDVKNLKTKSTTWLSERLILTSMNDHASRINDMILSLYEEEEKIYSSIDTVVEQDDAINFPVEFLNSLNPPKMSNHILKLKIGAPIMLIRNLSSPKLCNGTRLQVISLKQNIIEAKIITGCGSGDIIFIPRIPIICTDYEFQFKRIQFPIRVCFAITINKSQGQTLKIAVVDLSIECFSHGQLSVAFSRVGNAENLFILAEGNTTRNRVYKEVLV
ncbi:ATP-dependent DNA helicase PIF1-like [Cotesia typhae]|uniref:ATP-dependent DNA helicase PIF1-like n=1 Tax=Cotesia typhae TaxID=2053667 RepID=UPI003D68ACD9